MCRNSTHPFDFISHRNKQDIWTLKCHTLGDPKNFYKYPLFDKLEFDHIESIISTNTYAVTIKRHLFDITFQ